MPAPIVIAALAGAGILLLASSAKAKSKPAKTAPGVSPGGVVPPVGSIPFPSGALTGCPDSSSPDAGIAGLPSPLDAVVEAAVLSPVATPEALSALANQLAFCGQNKAAEEVIAKARSLGGPSIVEGGGPGGDGLRRKGIATIPSFQRGWNVRPGESPEKIMTLVFGPGETKAEDGRLRWVELIQYNGSKPTKGDPRNPYTSGYNFVSLIPGEQLLLPKSWNGWVDQQGNMRGAADPFPSA